MTVGYQSVLYFYIEKVLLIHFYFPIALRQK